MLLAITTEKEFRAGKVTVIGRKAIVNYGFYRLRKDLPTPTNPLLYIADMCLCYCGCLYPSDCEAHTRAAQRRPALGSDADVDSVSNQKARNPRRQDRFPHEKLITSA